MAQEFDVKLGKQTASFPKEGYDKYELLGYFRELENQKKREENNITAAAASPATEKPNNNPIFFVNKCRCSCREALAKSSATNWLLALIAFLLFMILITRN